MKAFCYKKYCAKTIKKFISKSIPIVTDDFNIIRGEENAGWINIWFKYNDIEFTITLSLAVNDLTELVEFFENMINLKQEMSLFLDDELISEPLLHASPIDKENVKLLIAEHKRGYDNWKNYGIKYNSQISNYDIKCDVIINKKKLLKEFYRVVKNIIYNCTIYDEGIYSIGYSFWKDNLRNIISYTR